MPVFVSVTNADDENVAIVDSIDDQGELQSVAVVSDKQLAGCLL